MTSVRISGGLAWLLAIPIVVGGAVFVTFRLAAAAVLAVGAAPWVARRHLKGSAPTRGDDGPSEIELGSEAFRPVDPDDRL